MLLQSIYYPFAMFSRRRNGVAIQPVVIGPTYESPSYGRVNYIDTSAILGDGVLHTFLINRNLREEAEVEIDHAGKRIDSILSTEVVYGTSPHVRNTYENPYNIISRPLQTGVVIDGKAIIHLPPLSFSAVTFKVS
jgi:alpha-N-arabinofuranosidase